MKASLASDFLADVAVTSNHQHNSPHRSHRATRAHPHFRLCRGENGLNSIRLFVKCFACPLRAPQTIVIAAACSPFLEERVSLSHRIQIRLIVVIAAWAAGAALMASVVAPARAAVVLADDFSNTTGGITASNGDPPDTAKWSTAPIVFAVP